MLKMGSAIREKACASQDKDTAADYSRKESGTPTPSVSRETSVRHLETRRGKREFIILGNAANAQDINPHGRTLQSFWAAASSFCSLRITTLRYFHSKDEGNHARPSASPFNTGSIAAFASCSADRMLWYSTGSFASFALCMKELSYWLGQVDGILNSLISFIFLE